MVKQTYKITYEYYVTTDDDKELIGLLREFEKHIKIQGTPKIETITLNEK